MPRLRLAARVFVSLFFLIGGIAHFLATDRFVQIVPPSFPAPVALVIISGVCELLGAIGLWVHGWRTRAGNALMVLTVCVTPANVYMWQHAEQFPFVSEQVLAWRLVGQVLLLALIWWGSRPDAPLARP